MLSIGLNFGGISWTPAALWLAVIASGLYHGLNPGMGWPLVVSSGLNESNSRALLKALWPLSVGHLLATLLILLPFSLLLTLIEWQSQVESAAGFLVIALGISQLIYRRESSSARIRPPQLGLLSFAVTIAHGAGLMLLPIYLGLCRSSELDTVHEITKALIGADVAMALLVSAVHSLAMITAGGFSAWLVYRYLSLNSLSLRWINRNVIWPLTLIFVGSLSLVLSHLH